MSYEKDSFISRIRSIISPNNSWLKLFNSNRFSMALRNEKGFMDMYILMFFLVIFLTGLAMMVGTSLGVLKEAQTKYMWFSESVDYAARAVNTTGGINGIVLNDRLAQEYFEEAMEDSVEDYRLRSFRSVLPGDTISDGVAQYPGYITEIIVPIIDADVPMVGKKTLEIPMKYFAVVKSTSY